MSTRVKIAVQMKRPGVPGWPCINYDYEKELARVMEPIYAHNPNVEFDIARYTDVEMARADYENDLKTYDGVLVLLMTNWLKIDEFYINQSRDGLPTIVADCPYCGSGTMLEKTSPLIRRGGFPVPMIASTDYNDIAMAVKLFDVNKRIKESRILVVRDEADREEQQAANAVWGCEFINKTADELMKLLDGVPDEDACDIANRWKKHATGILEPSDEDIMQAAKLYIAVKQMMSECNANALTMDCLSLSYNDGYGHNRRMYPCLAYHQMSNDGEIGICEADINSTISAMFTLFMTGRPGYVSDPVIDTSSDQIIYSHCVACRKVYGKDDPRTCQYYLRSHAEDKKGASVQVIFPCGEKLTTVQVSNIYGWASIHSAVSCGNAGGDNGCRSKLVAKCDAEKILENWQPQWHHVTVFGDYRKEMKNLFKLKGYRIIEEDR